MITTNMLDTHNDKTQTLTNRDSRMHPSWTFKNHLETPNKHCDYSTWFANITSKILLSNNLLGYDNYSPSNCIPRDLPHR